MSTKEECAECEGFIDDVSNVENCEEPFVAAGCEVEVGVHARGSGIANIGAVEVG